MGEESEERSGSIAGIVKSIFGRKKGELPVAPPPSPPQEIAQPPNVAELNLIKEKVQSVSRPVEAAADWKQHEAKQEIQLHMPPVAKTPQMDIAFKGPDTVSAPPAQALAKPRQQDAVQRGPATVSAPPAQAVAKTAQQDSTPQVSAGPPAYKKSSLDEIKRRIEESAQRKDPAHLKKNIEQVNEHLNYVKRKSALSEKKIEKIVDEKVREELERMGSSIKERLKRGPAQAEREQLEKFQKQLFELMDVSDKKSELELEQMRSQMEGMRRQMNDLPLIVARKELEELSPIRQEVAVLKEEMRKSILNVSDPAERSKLEDTLARAEALSRRLEYNPQVESVRAELGEIKSAMGSVASAIEKVGSSGEEIKKQESEARESIKQGMEIIKKEIRSVPEALKESEAPKLDSIRRSISELRTLVQQNAEAKQPPAERRMLNEILAHLSVIEQKQTDDERKLSRLLNLDEGSMKLMDSLRRRMDSVSRRVSSEGQAEMDAFREELRTLRNSVRASISASRSQEEQELLKKLHGELGRILAASEEKSAAALGELKGELSKVSSRLSRIPSALDARERPELDSIRSEIFGLQKVVGDALARPKGEEEKKLLRSMQSRLEELSQVSDARSVSEFGRLEKELADVRSVVSRIPSVVGARERPELEAIRAEVAGLQKFVSDALARPKNEEEKKLLRSLQSRLEGLLQVSEARSVAEFGRLEGELADVKGRISRVSAREKPEFDSIRGEIFGLQKVVGDALSRPRDEEERKLLEGMESRLENLLDLSGKRSAEEIGGLKKELSDIRRKISKIPSRVEAGEKPELDSLKGEVQAIRSTVEEELARPRNEEERKMLRDILSQLDGMVKFFDLRAGSTLDAVKSELDSVAGQVADIRAEKGDIASVAVGVHALGDGLKKALSTAGRKDRQALERLSAQIAALSSSLDSKAGSAADGIRSELEDMRNQLLAIVSAEQPEMDSVKSAVSALRRMVEKALARPGSGELDRRLSSLSAQIAEMLQVSEARTEDDIGQLRQKMDGIQKELEDIPAELSAEKPEIESIRSAVSSLQESLSSAGKSSLLAIKDKLDSIAAPKPQQADGLSGIKESIASLRDLLEKRVGPAEPQEGGLVPVRRPKRKAGRIQKRTGKRRAAVPRRQKAGERKKTAVGKAHIKKRAPLPSHAVHKTKAQKRASVPRESQSGVRSSVHITAGLRRSRAKAPRRKAVSTARTGASKRKLVSSIRAAIKKRGPGKRSISDIDSFIADIEKRRKTIPEIERRLGGEYSTQPRRGDVGTMIGLRERREPEERRPLERDEERRAPERDENRRGLGERRALERDEKDLPETRLHRDYESYLKDEKIGRIGSDVKRMHARLKDIRKLYEEEF